MPERASVTQHALVVYISPAERQFEMSYLGHQIRDRFYFPRGQSIRLPPFSPIYSCHASTIDVSTPLADASPSPGTHIYW